MTLQPLSEMVQPLQVRCGWMRSRKGDQRFINARYPWGKSTFSGCDGNGFRLLLRNHLAWHHVRLSYDVENDALPPHINQRVGRAQINGQVIGK